MILSRYLPGVAIVVTAIACVLATRRQRFTYAAENGRTLRLLVQGSGSATVVFESGLGPPLEMWGRVQPAVSRFAKTVSYDRAGVGLSNEDVHPRDGRHIASDLHRTLQSAQVALPYILVGASLGGPYVRIYAGMYPGDVAGIVLVDPTPDSARIDHAQSPEAAALPETLRQSRGSPVPSGIPVFLIRAEGAGELPFATETVRTEQRARRMDISAESLEHQAWIAGVPGGRLIVTHQSGHNVPIEQPDLVVETIRHAAALAVSRAGAGSR